jgi:hypothetical protein
MWRLVSPTFERRFTVYTFDHVGAGGSDSSPFDHQKYSTLEGNANDVVEIGLEAGIKGGVFVGHSCVIENNREDGESTKRVNVGSVAETPNLASR